MNVKDIVKGNNAHFHEYRAGNLWYRVVYDFKEGGEFSSFDFPVPIEDTEGATFSCETKAITLMRWIRKHVKTIEAGGD